MESTRAPANLGSVARTLTRIMRFRRSDARSGSVDGVGRVEDEDVVHKTKLSQNFADYYSGVLSEPHGDEYRKGEHGKQQQWRPVLSDDREVLESLAANLFASLSAIKASYAQLQVAQCPYDSETIQAADFAIVSELRRISEMKQSYVKNKYDPKAIAGLQPPVVVAQVEEQRNLIKTYQITTHKLETELKHRDAELLALQTELLESERKNQALEAKLRPWRSLSALDGLHPSGLNPTHFLAALRYTYNSIRSFTKLMMNEMESAGMDLGAAAGAIHTDVLRRKKPQDRNFAFESYACQKMFSDFHHKSFGFEVLEECSSWNRSQFFDEFAELKDVKWKQNPSHGRAWLAARFARAKYLSLVHPKMEASFFGNLDHRNALASGRSWPDSAFFREFAEMARRVWLLHCLFFSFAPESDRAIFQARRGSRFSEVFMESVTEEDGNDAALSDPVIGSGAAAAVGFTVVPGFRVGRTVIQCKVYLSHTVE